MYNVGTKSTVKTHTVCQQTGTTGSYSTIRYFYDGSLWANNTHPPSDDVAYSTVEQYSAVA